MKNIASALRNAGEWLYNKLGMDMRTKLIIIFLVVKVIPLVLLAVMAWQQLLALGNGLRDIAVTDSSAALNDSAVENIERMTTDTAIRVADFLYERDSDILYLAGLEPSEEGYRGFLEAMTGRLTQRGEWELARNGQSWARAEQQALEVTGGASTNSENNDMDGFHYRQPEAFSYDAVPLYDEITFVDVNGVERIKIVAGGSTKANYPMDPEKKDISKRENTYVRAEAYYEKLAALAPGEIYVSDVIGAYVGSNYIGMYTPDVVSAAAEARGYDIPYDPQAQAYAGMENPNGQRFEGIIRWATPVTGEDGAIIGYVTFALNHDHIMEFVDHITPMNERYTELPSAFEGNYAFIWDYQCRNICHPRHHSIAGYDPQTGDPEIPWLEASIYDAWQQSGAKKWTDFVRDIPTFDGQSRSKTPAPSLTRQGLVGLDGRYLNNAPQCTGWMDLTANGGSGSFYILWSGLYKLTTAAAIPYYTGQYAPSEHNGFSQRGFGIVTIGAGLEDFMRPAKETGEKLETAISQNLRETFIKLFLNVAGLVVLVVLIAIWIASFLTGNITRLIQGISRFRAGERQFRFNAPVRDEFGTLADSFDDMADSIVDSVKSPLCITDMDRKIIYMNDQGLAFCKLTLEEIVGTAYGDSSVYPCGTVYDPILALRVGREPEIYYDESSNRYIRGKASYFLSKEGWRVGYMIVSTDVTEMVLERMKVEAQRTLLGEIFTASPDLIWYRNQSGAYLAVNPRFSSISGRTPEDCIGKTALEVLPPDVAESFLRNDEEALASSLPRYTEERITFADGHEEILDSVRTPIIDTSGALVGLLGFARDVSVRVTIENELRVTQLELEEAVASANSANQHKGEFLARMSHEIRTPMNAIIGLTSIVQRKLAEIPQADESIGDVKGHIRQIETSSQHLLGLLNDILDISKIDAGKIELAEDIMDLSRLASTVAVIIQPRCTEKNICFETHFDEFTPSTFLGDSLRLRQVLINLLGNAVKFTPELGTITFRIERLNQEEDRTQLRFTVRDSGIGISDEMIATIFQPFEQAGRNISRDYGGTGLGLAISSRIVQLFGGEITVQSKPGDGSEFSFDIWLRQTQEAMPVETGPINAEGRFTGKRALLVDDVEINRMIVISLLEITGMEIDEAADGLEAVQKVEESPEGTYDIIFMDVQMPRMDGYEATSAIRALEREDVRTMPIVALTANAFQDDINRAHAHGMNGHITKPVDMDKLVEALFRYSGV